MKRNIIKNLWDTLLDAFFPARCLACEKEGADFCADCRSDIPLRGGFDHAGIFSLWEYGHPHVKNAIMSLKYKNKRTLATDIAESLYDVLLEQLAEKSLFHAPGSNIFAPYTYLVVPIPLSKQRFGKRGYNQAELLARELARKNPSIFMLELSVLRKIKDTRAQVSVKDREKRLHNTHGVFTVQYPEKVRGKTILLIDDVTTTGATLAEAKRVLLKAGARIVYGVTVAH